MLCIPQMIVPWLDLSARNITVSEHYCTFDGTGVHCMDSQINKALPKLRIRRSPYLVMHFHQGRLILENYITRRTFEASLATCELLSQFNRWTTVTAVTRELREYSKNSILKSAQNLLEHGLLITQGSDQDTLERRFGKEWQWPFTSRYYHYSTKIDKPFPTSAEVRGYYKKYLRGKKQPPIYKTYTGHSKVNLPKPSSSKASLVGTLRSRTTTREFSGLPISLKQLSDILYNTWGRVSVFDTVEFGELLHKTSPSAGARHPIEAYAIVNQVKGVRSGIYHYSVRDHALELLKQGDFRDKCVDFSAGQSWTYHASVLFIMTAIVARTAWKYRSARVYRAFLLDAGHLSQSFLLMSTALGLGAFSIGIIAESIIEKELGIDGVSEIALFAVGVGQPSNKVAGIGSARDKHQTNAE